MTIKTIPFARYLFTLALLAGTIGAFALTLATSAQAATSTRNDPRPGIVATPDTYAHPAPDATPGWYNHHGAHHIADLHSKGC